MSSMKALEEMHHLEPHVQVGRARAGVILFILSDAMSILALLAAGGYLNTLDTLRQFRAGGHSPSFVPALLATIALVLSGLCYYLWVRSARGNEKGGQRVIFILALVFMLASLVVEIVVGVTLGFVVPYHAYASLVLLFTWYTVFHLALAVIIGVLVLGRIMSGRLAAHPFIAEAVGYWWYYTVIAGVILWLFGVLL